MTAYWGKRTSFDFKNWVEIFLNPALFVLPERLNLPDEPLARWPVKWIEHEEHNENEHVEHCCNSTGFNWSDNVVTSRGYSSILDFELSKEQHIEQKCAGQNQELFDISSLLWLLSWKFCNRPDIQV